MAAIANLHDDRFEHAAPSEVVCPEPVPLLASAKTGCADRNRGIGTMSMIQALNSAMDVMLEKRSQRGYLR